MTPNCTLPVAGWLIVPSPCGRLIRSVPARRQRSREVSSGARAIDFDADGKVVCNFGASGDLAERSWFELRDDFVQSRWAACLLYA